jgi:hypothetical protein
MVKKLIFVMERETKNTVRFNEEVSGHEQPSIGVLYVQKHLLQALKITTGDKLVVTLSPTWEEK